MAKQTAYNVGIYVRLSQEDDTHALSDCVGKRCESLSIENQKLILTEYIKEQGWNLYSVYVDDEKTLRYISCLIKKISLYCQ